VSHKNWENQDSPFLRAHFCEDTKIAEIEKIGISDFCY
jgi:hypothetical protein